MKFAWRVVVATGVLAGALGGCAQAPVLRGTGDLGVVIERASGSLAIVEWSGRRVLGLGPQTRSQLRIGNRP